MDGLLRVGFYPIDQRLRAAAHEADISRKLLSIARKKNNSWITLNGELLCKFLVLRFQFVALGFCLWIVKFDGDEIRLGEFGELVGVEDLRSHHLAWGAPVGSREFKQNGFFLGGGLREGGVVVSGPDVRGVERGGGCEEEGECECFHRARNITIGCWNDKRKKRNLNRPI